jgi:hypothetical protein
MMILCYTLPMSENQQNWIEWSCILQKWGLKDTAVFLLEAAGSLNLLFAQMLYLSQPLLSGAVSPISLQAFAQTLENPADRQEFVSFLKETPTRGTGA